MAWTDTCKTAACIAIRNGVTVNIKTGRMSGVMKSIKLQAKESGIPFNTLKNWWYEWNKDGDVENPKKCTSFGKLKTWQEATCRAERLAKYAQGLDATPSPGERKRLKQAVGQIAAAAERMAKNGKHKHKNL